MSRRVLFLFSISAILMAQGQEVPVQDYSIGPTGQVQLQVEALADHYYILNVRHGSTGGFLQSTSMQMGQEGSLIITEPLAAYPSDHYQVVAHPIVDPADTDGDGADDLAEYGAATPNSPFNPAALIPAEDGAVSIQSTSHFQDMSKDGPFDPAQTSLEGREFLKFVIFHFDTDSAQVYFINMNTHDYHSDFFDALENISNGTILSSITGDIIYHPILFSENGVQGVFSFNFSFGAVASFETVQRTQELLATNMPFMQNNFSYFVLAEAQSAYEEELLEYEDSRVSVILESDILAEIDYLPLHLAEGFGFFKEVGVDETPTSRDIVLYGSLPNSLPRVGGIMTTVVQTPLSHVNLRAIQDDVPNAFVRDATDSDVITGLLDGYVYYRVDQDDFFIREATAEEVDAWYEDLRPSGAQHPPLDLSYTTILPLDDIDFDMSDGFGAKCANLATMRTFGFPDGTIPDGYGVPFHYYQEFMAYNGLFEEVEEMIADPLFGSDLEVRLQRLDELRMEIRSADMPQWMLDDLQEVHDAFPSGTSIRCRSSTNNEDLPGFSGAGLYTSKTQHPDEGHLSKSIKQVYASIWNFRAYEEREFYRIDHFMTSMGVLCHPNFEEEKANGVGVSLDPIYRTTENYYLNTQIGEELVTNPEADAIPEEILLSSEPSDDGAYAVLRYSNLVEDDQQIMTEEYLLPMRDYLSVIHEEFSLLYEVGEDPAFAMDIEYKITSDDRLVIKQARPWASYWGGLAPDGSDTGHGGTTVELYPNPFIDEISIRSTSTIARIELLNMVGQPIAGRRVDTQSAVVVLSLLDLAQGSYVLRGIGTAGEVCFSELLIRE